jgi:DNA-binding NtrC family response regulator
MVRGRREQALVDAALCLARDDEEWPQRWARAMTAVRTVIGFGRVALLTKDAPGFELRAGFDRPAPLSSADVARELACRVQGPTQFDLRGAGDEGRAEVLVAMVVPVKPGAVLYAESTSVFAGSDDRLDLLADVARLVGAYLPDDKPPVEVEVPTIPGLMGRSEPMRALLVAVARAASADGTIHIFGETGTGKERVARAIHDLSRRARSPFVALNAASLGQELLESQLFGHMRGAFSGAVQDAMGLVAEAEGGTLFLDEVADLHLASQAKLLRFLQEGEYRRLGDTRLRKADVRVLTAANIPLDDLVREGRFRKDLRYRIGGVVLEAPPLRTRGSDIVLLARHYLEKLAARDKVPVPRLSQDAVAALRAHSWPGNVRELQNEMERLVMVVRDRPARRDDLSPSLRSAAPRPSARALSEVRLAVERDHVSAALERHEGSRTRAAADLGITRQALHEKIRRLGLPAARPTPA